MTDDDPTPTPRDTVTTAAELDALPPRTITQDQDGSAWERGIDGWWCADPSAHPDPPHHFLPHQVLYRPDAPARGSADAETLRAVPYDEHERIVSEVCEERDRAIEAADDLAAALAPFEVRGEHSSMNDPWQNALDYGETLRAEVERLRTIEARWKDAVSDVVDYRRERNEARAQRDAARTEAATLRTAIEGFRARLVDPTRLATEGSNIGVVWSLDKIDRILAAHPAPEYPEDGAPHALVPGTSTDDPPGYPGDPRWCDVCGRAAEDPAHPAPEARGIPTDSGLGYWYREPTPKAAPPTLTVTRERADRAAEQLVHNDDVEDALWCGVCRSGCDDCRAKAGDTIRAVLDALGVTVVDAEAGRVETDEDRHGEWIKDNQRYADGCREDLPHNGPEADR